MNISGKFTHEFIALVCTRFIGGESIAEIAEATGNSEGEIEGLLKENQEIMRRAIERAERPAEAKRTAWSAPSTPQRPGKPQNIKRTVTGIMAHAVLIAVPVILAIGSFLGFPNDPMLSGFYWGFIALWKITELVFEEKEIKNGTEEG